MSACSINIVYGGAILEDNSKETRDKLRNKHSHTVSFIGKDDADAEQSQESKLALFRKTLVIAYIYIETRKQRPSYEKPLCGRQNHQQNRTLKQNVYYVSIWGLYHYS